MRSSAARALSVGVVATLSAAGLAWHECVLLAAAAAMGHRLFLWRMDDGAPWDAWRAGVRCLFAGLLGLLAAVALLAVIAAGLAGYWQMEHHHARATLALVAAADVRGMAARPRMAPVPGIRRHRDVAGLGKLADGPNAGGRSPAFGCADVNQLRKSP